MKRKILPATTLVLLISLSSCSSNSTRTFSNEASKNTAIFTLFTYDGSNDSSNGVANLGHSFISIKNTSATVLSLGAKEIQLNEEVCFSTWCIENHKGIWCNIEDNYIKYYGRYIGRISLSFNIDLNDIATINNFISNNDYWTATKNCSYFSLNLYNSIVSNENKIETPLIYNPSYLAKEIKKFDNYETNREINTDEEISILNDESNLTYTLYKEGDVHE